MELEQLIIRLKRLVGILSMTTILCAVLLSLLLYGHHTGVYFSFENPDSSKPEVLAQEVPAFQQEALRILEKGEGRDLVITHCTVCHSARLVAQNRATPEGWVSMIRWMQSTQNLWDLGENESKIVAYLSQYYAPEQVGRRASLSDIEWYPLEE